MVTLTLLIITICSVTPNDMVIVDHVDLVELNHYCDQDGDRVLDQLIFYEWNRYESCYQVVDWRLYKPPMQRPLFDEKRERYITTWHDNNIDSIREVHAKIFRESWTQYDPEVAAREFLPKERRRNLTSPHKIKTWLNCN